jgi:hypothetical protein
MRCRFPPITSNFQLDAETVAAIRPLHQYSRTNRSTDSQVTAVFVTHHYCAAASHNTSMIDYIV